MGIAADLQVKNAPVSDDNPLPVSGALSTGTAGTGISPPAGGGGLLGFMSGVFDRLALFAGITKGTKTSAESIPVTLSSDGPFSTNVGTTADAAITADATGTLSGKLRGLVKILASVWDSTNNRISVWVYNATRSVATATINNGESVSATLDLNGTALLGIVMPSGWTSATLTIEASTDNFSTSTISTLYDSSGSQIGSWSSFTASAGYAVDPLAFMPYRYIRLKSSVNQGAARTFGIITRPLA